MPKEKRLPADQKVIHVAIVEDQSVLRCSLKRTVSSAPGLECIATCANAEQAIQELPALRPDVVIMDINLPAMSGVECVSHLVEKIPGVLIIMLTVYDHTDAIFDSLKSGACGYLHKPVRGSELITAIREVVAGGSPMSAKVARLVVQAFCRPSPAVEPKPENNLSERERDVLDLILQGYLYKQIADQLNLSVYTVNFHIRNIYAKLQVHSRAEAMAKMRNHS
jgi:DNA-binding NarL/FixJ family response regulator